MSSLVYRLVHAPVTRESWVRLPGEEFSRKVFPIEFYFLFKSDSIVFIFILKVSIWRFMYYAQMY